MIHHTFEISLFWLTVIILAALGVGVLLHQRYYNRKLPWDRWTTLTFFTDPNLGLEGWVDEGGNVDDSWFTTEFSNKPIYAGRIPHGTKIRVVIKGISGMGGYVSYDMDELVAIARKNQLPVKA
jgi:hypothetical protein